MTLLARLNTTVTAIAEDIKALFTAMPVAGEIRLCAGASAPPGWAFCNGQALNVTDHPALFSKIGGQYGGNGVTTFSLPALRDLSPRGGIASGIGAGDSFSAILPGDVTACYIAQSGNTTADVAAGLHAAILLSAGYAGQPFIATVADSTITLTAKVAGTGFTVQVSTATAPGFSTLIANADQVAQVDAITISPLKFLPFVPVRYIIYLG